MLTAVVFLGLSSLTASAPHFRADRHGASFYEGTPAGALTSGRVVADDERTSILAPARTREN